MPVHFPVNLLQDNPSRYIYKSLHVEAACPLPLWSKILRCCYKKKCQSNSMGSLQKTSSSGGKAAVDDRGSVVLSNSGVHVNMAAHSVL